jgi:hypothetical protein
MDYAGKRQFFTLSKTAGKRVTLQTAQDLDTHHRKIALGVLPPPARQRATLTRTMEQVLSEYLCWGAFQGGIGGRPGMPSISIIVRANCAGGVRLSGWRPWLIATASSLLSNRPRGTWVRAGAAAKRS